MQIAVVLEKLDIRRGGAEVAALRMIQDLARRGHTVHVVTNEVAVDLPPATQIHLIPLPRSFVTLRLWAFAHNVERLLREKRFDFSIAAAGRGFAEDALWAQGGSYAGSTEGAARSYYYNPLRCALRRHQHWYSPRSAMYRRLERGLLDRNPFIIAPSRMIADGFPSVPVERIRIVPYQINLKRFSVENTQTLRKSAREALGLGDQLMILCVAQNFRRKGVRPLVEAVNRLRENVCLIVAGSTPQKGSDRVRFIGQHSRIEELYAAADVFCLPTFFDPCAIASIEAMACGLPSVTSRFNGAAELMHHSVDGFVLQDPSDAGEIAGVLEKLFDAELRRKVGAAAVATARAFVENPANDIGGVVEELATLKSRRTSAAS